MEKFWGSRDIDSSGVPHYPRGTPSQSNPSRHLSRLSGQAPTPSYGKVIVSFSSQEHFTNINQLAGVHRHKIPISKQSRHTVT